MNKEYRHKLKNNGMLGIVILGNGFTLVMVYDLIKVIIDPQKDLPILATIIFFIAVFIFNSFLLTFLLQKIIPTEEGLMNKKWLWSKFFPWDKIEWAKEKYSAYGDHTVYVRCGNKDIVFNNTLIDYEELKRIIFSKINKPDLVKKDAGQNLKID